MDRSSHQSLRPERIANSPYRRPAANGMKKSSSFASIRSIFSYPLNLFRNPSEELSLPTTTSDLPVQVEANSESGSEDEWNGQPPASANGMDVFDAAAGAGRTGPEFEARTASWRAKGEVPGGRRDLARRSLEVCSGVHLCAKMLTMKGIAVDGPSGSGPSTSLIRSETTPALPLALTTPGPRSTARPPVNTNKRPLQSNTPPSSFAAPTPSFLPHAANTGKSASATALQAIFANKDSAADFTEEDLRLIEILQKSLKAEAQSARIGEVSSTPSTPKYSGWSAGTPRVPAAVPNSLTGRWEEGTPSRNADSPAGSAFAVGASTPLNGTPGKKPFSVRYLGPGMSPKRMLGKAKSSGGIKPLFSFASSSEEESAPKKRKVDDEEDSTPAKGISSALSMPNLASLGSTSTPKLDKGKTRAGPHPLSQSSTAKDANDPVTIGKKRAADFMLALIEEQTAPERAAKANGALTENIIINPYDIPSEAPITPSTPSRYESPRKVQLRSSTSTPKRGAAAKLDASKGRMLSPYERLSGMKQWEAPAKKQTEKEKEVETEPEDESMEVEEVVAQEAARNSRRSPPPPAAQEPNIPAVPKRVEFPEPEPFKPFTVPSIETPSRPIPSFGFTPTPSETFASPSQESALASSTRKDTSPAFTFKPSQPAASINESAKDDATVVEKEQPNKASTSTFDPTKVFLSARDTALAIAKPALPFFTFTIPTSAKDDAATALAKEQAKKATLPTFTFMLPSPSSLSAVSAMAPAHGNEEWECSMCMLKNPGTAKEKCTICENPRPAPQVAAAPTPTAAPAAPAASAASHGDEQWTCDMCMLKNPGTAKEKCTICENPRPAPKASAVNGVAPITASAPALASAPAPSVAPTPFQWPTGMAPQKKEGWTCGLCTCVSPESATKCIVCETPR